MYMFLLFLFPYSNFFTHTQKEFYAKFDNILIIHLTSSQFSCNLMDKTTTIISSQSKEL